MSNTIKGTVKWFNDAKGFGFIEHEKGDVFVHFSSIESSGFKTLKNGEEVTYELDAGEKGLHAKKVVRLNPPKDLASQIEVERYTPAANESERTEEISGGVIAQEALDSAKDKNKDS